MIHRQDIRYVRLGTSELDSAVHYASEALGLEVARRSAKAVHFQSDNRDRMLVYFDGSSCDPARDGAFWTNSLSANPSSFCMWGSKPDIPEFKPK